MYVVMRAHTNTSQRRCDEDRSVVVYVALALMAALAACRPASETPATPASGSGETTVAEPDDLVVVGPHFTALEITGQTRGQREAADLYDGCVGLIGPSPERTLRVDGDQPLTMTVTPRGRGFLDLTLVVVGPDGTAHCADDGDTLDPVLAQVWDAGEYDVYVGVRSDEVASWALTLRQGIHSEDGFSLGSVFPPPVQEGDPPEPMDEGTFGGLRVRPGTGPATLEGQAGGTRRALDLGAECAGWIAPAPDHVVEITAPEELTFRVRSSDDTTLVVRGPGDAVFCRDDDEGLDPVLRQVFAPGTWHVYVGAYDEDVTAPYRLTVSR